VSVKTDLRGKAQKFVSILSDAINLSVADGIRLNYVGSRDGSKGWIGYQLKTDDITGRGFPLGVTNHNPTCYLYVNYHVTVESEQGFLKVLKATFSLARNPEGQGTLFHYDFERDKQDFPSAHLQVLGDSATLNELNELQGVTRQLGRLHFPVGGVRFRPCLEDVLEFLIVERFVEHYRENWQQALTAAREEFHDIQLRAAVRRRPSSAVEQLNSMGYMITPPEI